MLPTGANGWHSRARPSLMSAQINLAWIIQRKVFKMRVTGFISLNDDCTVFACNVTNLQHSFNKTLFFPSFFFFTKNRPLWLFVSILPINFKNNFGILALKKTKPTAKLQHRLVAVLRYFAFPLLSQYLSI